MTYGPIPKMEMHRSPDYLRSVAVYGGGIVGKWIVKCLTDLKKDNLEVNWYSQHLSEADESSLGYNDYIILQDMKPSDSLHIHGNLEGLLATNPDVLVFANSDLMPKDLNFYKGLGSNRDKIISFLYSKSVDKFKLLMTSMLPNTNLPLLMIVSNPPENLANLARTLGYDSDKILTSSPDRGRLQNLIYLDADIRSQFNRRLDEDKQILSPRHVNMPLLGEHSSPVVVPVFSDGTFDEISDQNFNKKICEILQTKLRRFGPKVMECSIKGNVPYADAATRLVEDIERLYLGDSGDLQSVGYFQQFSLDLDGEKHQIKGFFYGLPPLISDSLRVMQPTPMDGVISNEGTLNDILDAYPSAKMDIIQQAKRQVSLVSRCKL